MLNTTKRAAKKTVVKPPAEKRVEAPVVQSIEPAALARPVNPSPTMAFAPTSARLRYGSARRGTSSSEEAGPRQLDSVRSDAPGHGRHRGQVPAPARADSDLDRGFHGHSPGAEAGAGHAALALRCRDSRGRGKPRPSCLKASDFAAEPRGGPSVALPGETMKLRSLVLGVLSGLLTSRTTWAVTGPDAPRRVRRGGVGADDDDLRQRRQRAPQAPRREGEDHGLGLPEEDVPVTGTVDGDRVRFEVKDRDGSTSAYDGRLKDGLLSGTVTFSGESWGATPPSPWSARRPAADKPVAPRTLDFEPKEFYRIFSGGIEPVATDLAGRHGAHARRSTPAASTSTAKSRVLGGNPQTGPFYVETRDARRRARGPTCAAPPQPRRRRQRRRPSSSRALDDGLRRQSTRTTTSRRALAPRPREGPGAGPRSRPST